MGRRVNAEGSFGSWSNAITGNPNQVPTAIDNAVSRVAAGSAPSLASV
jgi:hypothetical protein